MTDQVRRVLLDRPFTQGMVTDQPAYKLGPQNSAFAQDLIAPEGIARQRKGWAYNGTVADAAVNLRGIYRNKFILGDATKTITTGSTTAYVHNAAGAGTTISSAGVGGVLPRCVYRDELMLCSQDGTTPMMRYSGAINSPIAQSAGTATFTIGEATVTGMTMASAPPTGSYASTTPTSPMWPSVNSVRVGSRILNATTTSITLEGVRSSTAVGIAALQILPYGYGYPCVTVYAAGTAANNVTTAQGMVGYGTSWNSEYAHGFNDAILTLPSDSNAEISIIQVVNSATSISCIHQHTMSGKFAYVITRAMPFKDAAAHKGSLWGTGVNEFPDRVYVSPPGWNPAFPPGTVEPFDPAYDVGNYSSNANDFLLDYIDVPSAYDGDVNVAILSSPGPLLVLKRGSVHGIFGSFPNFNVDKLMDGVGCIDIRSAISTASGQFWAGEHGIYAYQNGQIVDLTRGKINREWRALTHDFDYGTNDYCTIGQVYDHLFVSIVTGGGTTDRCYVYDMANQAWSSRFTNHKARYFFSAQVDGEEEELYWVGDSHQGRVMTSSATVNSLGTAKDGDGTPPRLKAWTGEGMDGVGSVDGDSRMLDLSVSTNILDAGAVGSTSMAVSVKAGGSLESQANATKVLTPIGSDTADRIDRKRYRSVNTKGRLLQVQLDVDTLGTNDTTTTIEIPEMTATLRDRRDRT